MNLVSIPSPYLTYHFWHATDRPDPTDLVGEGPPLYDVHEATANTQRGPGLSIIVTGRMRKRDGDPGPRRCLTIDLGQEQPDWLVLLSRDARRRLYDV